MALKPGWAKGQSGNPAGRPKGPMSSTQMRHGIAKQLPEILKTVTAAAISGDMAAAKLLLDRALPPCKPVESTVQLSLPDGTLTDQGRAILSAIAAGVLAPSAGATLLGAVAALGRVAELDEMAARITELERQNGNT